MRASSGAVTGRLSHRAVAWTVAIGQVLLLAQASAFWAWSGQVFAAEFAIPSSAALALVGALVASKRPDNHLGWFLLLLPVPGLIAFLGTEYFEVAQIYHVGLPAASAVNWMSNWVWTPSVGLASMLIVRFPDGRVPPRWRLVDLTAVAGTVVLGGAFAWMPFSGAGNRVTAATALVGLGLVMIALGAAGGLGSLVWRYRHGDRELRLQMKWMLLATIALTAALVFAAVLALAFAASHDWALAPFFAALGLVPIAIGVAILKHRLFDIDLIISRTLVYVTMTGALGGLYIAMIELMQQLSILYTGQRSETAIVVTAFVVAGAFTPIQKWAETIVERRFRRGDVAARLLSVSASAESVVRVIDPHRFARWLVDESVVAFEAEGGALYLYRHHRTNPFHSRGTLESGAPLEIRIHHGDEELGRLVLGRRRGGIDYSRRDVDALNRSGAALGTALALASDLGHLAQSGIKATVSDGVGEVVPVTRVTRGSGTRMSPVAAATQRHPRQ